MRIISFAIVLCLMLGGYAQAIAPITAGSIQTALEYGKKRADLPLEEFFMPWTVYEEKAAKLDEIAERAHLYTPFLLLAADARDKAIAGKPIKLKDAEKVLTDYNGYIIFSVSLFGFEPDFADKVTVTLRQGKRTIKAHNIAMVPTEEKGRLEPLFASQCYVYFHSKDINADKTVKLEIVAADKRKRSFHFDLAAYR